MVVIRLSILIRKGKELKAFYRASTTAIRDYITTCNIVLTLVILFL